MSSSYIQFSTPALRKLVHSNQTIGTTIATLLTPPVAPERRVVVIVQNKSSTAKIEIICDSTSTSGLAVYPLSSISIDNYNGTVRCVSDSPNTLVHIAYGSV